MKKGDARREALLDTAERLFCTKGYERTTVQDILDALDYSKGGFYHHFDSKLALLNAICERRAQESADCARTLLAQEGDTLQQLNRLLHDTAFFGDGNTGFAAMLIQAAYCADGALMREKMKQMQLERLLPLMEAVLEAGARDQSFFVTEISETAELVLRLYMQFTDEAAFLLADAQSEEMAMERMLAKLRVYRSAIERVLAAPFGSVVLFDAQELFLLTRDVVRRSVSKRADKMLAK